MSRLFAYCQSVACQVTKSRQAKKRLASRRRQSLLEALEDRRLMIATPLKFDFGIQGSPVAAGYNEVRVGTTYADPPGYGWETSPAGGSSNGTTGLDELLRDNNQGNDPRTFKVKVDADPGQYDVTLYSGSATLDQNDVQVQLEGTTAFSFNTAAGSIFTGTYRVTVSDGELTVLLQDTGASNDRWFINGLDVVPYSQAPVLTLSGTATYTENTAAMTLAGSATLTDADNTNFNGGTLTVAISANADAADVLKVLPTGTGAGQIGVSGANITYGGVVIGTFSGGQGATPLTISLNQNATVAATQALVRRIGFQNTSDAPSTTPRTVTFQLADGDGGVSNVPTKTVNVNAVNDVATIDLGAVPIYTTGGPAIFLAPSATASDVDATSLANGSGQGSLEIWLSANARPGDQLAISPQGSAAGQIGLVTSAGITSVTYGGAAIGTLAGGSSVTGSNPLTLTFNTSATLAAVQALVRRITLVSSETTPPTFQRVLSVKITEVADNAQATYTQAINETPLIDLGAGVTFTEDAPAIYVAPAATVADDSPNFAGGSLTLQISANAGGADQLAIAANGSGAGQVDFVPNGPLYDVRVSGVAIGTLASGSGTVSGSTAMVLNLNASSTPEAVQAVLRRLTFYNPNDGVSLLTRTVSVTLTEGGTETATQSIAVVIVNDAPVNTVPNAQTVDEDTELVFSSTNGNRITIADPDAFSNAVQVTLSVNSGTLTLPSTSGLTFITGDGSADAMLVFTGSIGNINTALNGLSYQPSQNYNGSDTLTITTNDLGHNGTGGAQSDTDNVAITVSAVNDAPVNTVPPDTQPVNEDTELVFNLANSNRITIADIDAASSSVQVTLSVDNGTLSLPSTSGLTFITGDGAADSAMTFTGSVADINAALNGLSYRPSLNYNGADTLTITTDDQGNTGTGDAQSDTDSVAITVNAVNDAPVISWVGSLTYQENSGPTILATGASVSDVDSPNYDEGVLTIELTANAESDDRLTIAAQGTGAGQIGLSGANDVTFAGITIGAYSGGSGTTPLIVSLNAQATPASVQALLLRIAYHNVSDSFGSGPRSIAATLSDGDGGSSLPTVVAVNMEAVNDAPVNTVPDAQSVNEDTMLVFSSANVNQLRLLDVDAAASDVKVTLSVEHGTLSLANTSGLTFTTGDGSEDAMLVFTGSIADINTALNSLQYQPNQNYNGSDTLSFTTDDQGNSGIGGAQSDSDNVAITVNAVNDAPVNMVPEARTVNEDTELVFSSANAVSVSDIDADSSPVQVTVNVANGTLTLQSTTGLTFSAGDGISDSAMTFTGSIADVNAAMNGLRYNPNPNYNGPDTLNITTSDQGNSGAGEILYDTDNVSITVNAVNDAPVNTVPGNPEVNEDTTLAFSSANSNGITIADPDAGSSLIQVTLSVDNGTLTLPSTTGLTFITGDGSEDALLVFTGSIADINTALNNGLSYLPNANYYGSDTLTITTSDQGNSGVGGTLYDTDYVTITVNSVNDDPTISGILEQPIDEDDATNLLSFTVLDAETAAGSLDVSATSDNLALVPLSGIVLGGSGKDRTITITPAANQFGTATITLTVTDANGGSNQQTFTVNVASVNDAPVNTVPEAQSVNEDTALEFNSTNGKLISISDVDADWSDLKVTLSVEHGTLSLATAAGLTFITGDGSEDAMLVFTGSRSAINTALDGLSYQPSLNYNGPDTLTITTDDQGFSGAGGTLSDMDSVAITVNAVNDAPVAVVDPVYPTDEDVPLNGTRLSLLANFYDPEGAPLTWAVYHDEQAAVPTPEHGQVLVNTDGSFTYIPDSNYNGPDSFDYRVFDGALWSEPLTVTIHVASVNDAPTVTGATEATIDYNSQSNVISFTIHDDDGPVGNLDISTPTSSNSTLIPSSNIVLGGSDENRTLSITPAVNQSGTAVISFTVSDDAGGETTHEITVTVRGQSPWMPGVTGDVNNDGVASEDDLDALRAWLDTTSSTPVDPNGPAPDESYLDVNGDWKVDDDDRGYLSRLLSAGSSGEVIATLVSPRSGAIYKVKMSHTDLTVSEPGNIEVTLTIETTPINQIGFSEGVNVYLEEVETGSSGAGNATKGSDFSSSRRLASFYGFPSSTYTFTTSVFSDSDYDERLEHFDIKLTSVGVYSNYDPYFTGQFGETTTNLQATIIPAPPRQVFGGCPTCPTRKTGPGLLGLSARTSGPWAPAAGMGNGLLNPRVMEGQPAAGTTGDTFWNPATLNQRSFESGTLNSFSPSGFSSHPVRYTDGTVLVGSTDLESSGFGMPWGITRQWTNGVGYAQANVVGAGMVITQQPVLIEADGRNTVGVVTDGHTVRYFDLEDGVYVPRGFFQEKLAYDVATREYVLTLTDGAVMRFYGYSLSLPFNQRGTFKSYVDGGGNTTSVVSHTTSGDIQEVQRTYTENGDTITESFLYTYVGSTANTGLIDNVVLRRQVNAGSWTTERKAEYAYYVDTDNYGNLGDLKTATIKDGLGTVLDTTYYRYYKPSESNGYKHGLKHVFYPASYARLVEEQGSDVDNLSDSVVAPYADHYFEYDLFRRATKEIAQGAGCSTCNGGQGSFTYSYTERSSTAPDDINNWKIKTVETLPDGNQNIVFTNYRGQVILQSYKDTTTNDEWISYFRYDAEGRTILAAQPSAVSGYDENSADLVSDNAGDLTYIRNSAGLVTVYEYYSSTTATNSTAGGVAGYLKKVSIRNGETGTLVPQQETDYIARTAGGNTNYLPAHETIYTNNDGTGALTTAYAYTFYTGTTKTESQTTTPPAGTPNTVYFDTFSRPVWLKDANGFLHYTEYDAKTGAVVKQITDVDTTQSDFSGKPAGWTTPAGGGAHAVTSYEVDGLGRPTKVTDPDGRITYTVYNDSNHEIRIYPGWNTTTNAPTGPTIVVREDRDGSYSEEITMSATPDVVGGRPTGTEAIGNLESLRRTFFNDAGQAVQIDDYFNLSGLTYTTATTLGTLNTHFYRTTLGYDHRGRQSRTVRADGTIFRTVYDGLGRPVSEWLGTDDTPDTGFWSPTNPAGMQQMQEYQYDQGGVGDSQVTAVTDALQHVTTLGYDFRGRVTQTTLADPDGAGPLTSPVYAYAYDNTGRMTQTTDARNHVTTYVYDDSLQKLTITLPDPDDAGPQTSPIIVRLLDAMGHLVSETDANGGVTSYTYDGLGRLKKVTQPDPDDNGPLTSPETTYQYDDNGNLRFIADPLTKVTEMQYDRLNRLVKEIGADPDDTGPLLSPKTEYGYDTAGRLYSITDPLDRVTTLTYDDLGQLKTITAPDPDGEDPLTSPVTQYGYDAAGRRTSVTDPLTHVTSYQYDLYDNVRERTDPDPDGAGPLTSPVTTYVYDAAGNLRTLTDPVGNTTTWTYDDLNRLATETNELGKARSFEYDAAGNLTQRTDRRGLVTKYDYDNLNRRTEEKWLDASLTVIRTFSYGYDAVGQLKTASDPEAAYSYNYDKLGRVTDETHSLTGLTPALIYTSTYDANSRRTDLFAQIGGTADYFNHYVYDNLNRLTRLEQSGQTGGNAVAEKRIDFGYNDAGQFKTINRYESLTTSNLVATTTYDYDGIGRLTGLTHAQGLTTLASYTYGFDAAGRITSVDSLLDGFTSYTNDATGQLTGADHTGQTDESYSYDENGNRTMTGYVIDDNNRLTSDGTYTYEYDDEGNRTARETIATGERVEYQWDYRNRLTKIIFKDSTGTVTKTVEQSYDYLNRWIRREVDNDGAGQAPATDTFFSYLDGQIALEFDGGSASDLSHRYLWGPGVDQILADEQVTAGNTLWPLTDHLNTTRDIAVRDTSTGVVSVENHRQFDSFGNLISETDSTVDLLFGFTARLVDEATGLQNNLHRWYDGVTGQWMTEDPIGFAGGDENLRRYVGNQSTIVTDPAGLAEKVPPWKYWDPFHPLWQPRPETDKPGDPAIGLPKDVEGEWHPKEFFAKSPYSWKKRKWGCGGMAAFRVLGDKGRRPHDFYNLPGVKGYSSFEEAVSALKGGGTIVAIQQSQAFTLDGKELDGTEHIYGIGSDRIKAPGWGNGNFATLLGTDKNWYWEWANTGTDWENNTPLIKHSNTLPYSKYTLYFVIPGEQTMTKSPFPEYIKFCAVGG